jgi:hypothetical protein
MPAPVDDNDMMAKSAADDDFAVVADTEAELAAARTAAASGTAAGAAAALEARLAGLYLQLQQAGGDMEQQTLVTIDISATQHALDEANLQAAIAQSNGHSGAAFVDPKEEQAAVESRAEAPMAGQSVDALEAQLQGLYLQLEQAGGDMEQQELVFTNISAAQHALEEAQLAAMLEQSAADAGGEVFVAFAARRMAGDVARGGLPLGIVFPTARGTARTQRLQAQLNLAESDVRARLEAEADRAADRREAEIGELLASVAEAEGQVVQAEGVAKAAASARDQRAQVAREREAQQERLRREVAETERQKAQVAREKVENLKREEAETGEYLARNGALSGDLRMCRSCRAGPIENLACRNLSTHNEGNQNACKNCGWFSAEWHDWPMWDKVRHRLTCARWHSTRASLTLSPASPSAGYGPALMQSCVLHDLCGSLRSALYIVPIKWRVHTGKLILTLNLHDGARGAAQPATANRSGGKIGRWPCASMRYAKK